jgi:sarcosine oxidase subunit gamma
VTAIPHSPLEHLDDDLSATASRTGGAVRLREIPFLAQVDVHVAGDHEALARALGVALPAEPGRWIAGEPSAIWLGPKQWLVVGSPGSQAEIERRARAAFGDHWGSIVDVSDQRTAIELTGPAAREVLETGCSIDLHPRAFAPGRCAQTLVARTGVVLLQCDAGPTYRLLVRCSFADHLARWLMDAAIEHEPPQPRP